MVIIDMVIAILILGLAFLGFWRGFICEIIETIGALAAALLTYTFYPTVYSMVSSGEPSGWITKMAVMVGLFIVIMIAISLTGRMIRKFLRKINLGMYDRLMGFILGAVKGGIVVSILVSAALWTGPAGEKLIAQSNLAKANLLTLEVISKALPDELYKKQLAALGEKAISVISEKADFKMQSISQAMYDSLLSLTPLSSAPDAIAKFIDNADSEPAEVMAGQITAWDEPNFRGEVTTADNGKVVPIYYGSFVSEESKISDSLVGRKVSFQLTYSPFLNEVCGTDITFTE